ncbi:hypothetical protein Noda2021_08980 [Candidatus Dependentiae bacterium Noda2021]|nr:hypothetical protein Noda2021_08980 [Candidatus Dependentiae bacterium Noda2021]
MKTKNLAIALLVLATGTAVYADYGNIVPRFEIRNHDVNPIAITLWQLGTMQPEYIVVNNKEIPGKRGSQIAQYTNVDIDTTIPGYLLQITYNNKGKPTRVVYKLAPSQIMYLAWENNALRPQKGTGIFSKTSQSGFDLTNNIVASKIVRQ